MKYLLLFILSIGIVNAYSNQEYTKDNYKVEKLRILKENKNRNEVATKFISCIIESEGVIGLRKCQKTNKSDMKKSLLEIKKEYKTNKKSLKEKLTLSKTGYNVKQDKMILIKELKTIETTSITNIEKCKL